MGVELIQGPTQGKKNKKTEQPEVRRKYTGLSAGVCRRASHPLQPVRGRGDIQAVTQASSKAFPFNFLNLSTGCSYKDLIPFPALTGQLTTICNSQFRGFSALFWLPRASGICTVHIHTFRGNTHMYKKETF